MELSLDQFLDYGKDKVRQYDYDIFYVDPNKLEKYLSDKFKININFKNIEVSNLFIKEVLPENYKYEELNKGKKKGILKVKKKTKLPSKEGYKNNGRKKEIDKGEIEKKEINIKEDNLYLVQEQLENFSIKPEENQCLSCDKKNVKIKNLKSEIKIINEKYCKLKSDKNTNNNHSSEKMEKVIVDYISYFVSYSNKLNGIDKFIYYDDLYNMSNLNLINNIADFSKDKYSSLLYKDLILFCNVLGLIETGVEGDNFEKIYNNIDKSLEILLEK